MDYSKYQIYDRIKWVGEEPCIDDVEMYRFQERTGDEDEYIDESIVFFAGGIFPHGFGAKKKTVKVYIDDFGRRVEPDDPHAHFQDYEVHGIDAWAFSYNIEMWSKRTLRQGQPAEYTRIDGEDAKLFIHTGLWEVMDEDLREYLLQTFPEIQKELDKVEVED